MNSPELQRTNANYDATVLLERVRRLFDRDSQLLGRVVIRSVLKPAPGAGIQHVMTRIDVLPQNQSPGAPELRNYETAVFVKEVLTRDILLTRLSTLSERRFQIGEHTLASVGLGFYDGYEPGGSSYTNWPCRVFNVSFGSVQPPYEQLFHPELKSFPSVYDAIQEFFELQTFNGQSDGRLGQIQFVIPNLNARIETLALDGNRLRIKTTGAAPPGCMKLVVTYKHANLTKTLDRLPQSNESSCELAFSPSELSIWLFSRDGLADFHIENEYYSTGGNPILPKKPRAEPIYPSDTITSVSSGLPTAPSNSPKTPSGVWERIAAFSFGVVFIVVMLYISIYVPNPTETQWFTFRVILALAAAGVGAMLPGLLRVSVPQYVRAGGALALFAIVYWFNPPRLVTAPPQEKRKTEQQAPTSSQQPKQTAQNTIGPASPTESAKPLQKPAELVPTRTGPTTSKKPQQLKKVPLEKPTPPDKTEEINQTVDDVHVKAQRHEPVDQVTAQVSKAPVQYAPGGINIGGSNAGTAIVNNFAPPLKLTASVETAVSDKEGLLKTIVTVVPNIPVSAPTSVAFEFDKPISSISFWVKGAAGVIGGGPYRLGTHALISVGTGFNAQHPLQVTVYSEKPVSLLQDPVLE